jgi:hypothetical protein
MGAKRAQAQRLVGQRKARTTVVTREATYAITLRTNVPTPMTSTLASRVAMPRRFAQRLSFFTKLARSCPESGPAARVKAAGAGATAGLSFGLSSDHYSYGWQTSAAWAGTCRQFCLQLNDGSAPHTAIFLFFS